jgi:hypothetical protein
MSSHRFCQMGCGNKTSTLRSRFCSKQCRDADKTICLARTRSKSVVSAVYHALAKEHPEIFGRLNYQARKEKP